jgi:hypothetical protein
MTHKTPVITNRRLRLELIGEQASQQMKGPLIASSIQ